MQIEAELVANWLFLHQEVRPDVSRIFSAIVDCLADSSLVFPEPTSTQNKEKMLELIWTSPDFWSLSRLNVDDKFRARHEEHRKSYVSRMAELQAKLKSLPRLSKQQAVERALLEERLFLTNKLIFPQGRKILITAALTGRAMKIEKLMDERGEGGKQRIKEIFSRMPISDQYARLLAFQSMEIKRAPRTQDFFDIEHGTTPAVFADAFVTLDRRLATMVKAAGRGRGVILESLDALTYWLTKTPTCQINVIG